MVAITVILAAVIGTFVLGLGDNVESAPQAQLQVQENTDSAGQFDLRHRGGDTIDYNEFELVIEGSALEETYSYDADGVGETEYTDNSGGDGTISVGETDTISFGNPGGSGSNNVVVTVTLVHTPSDNIVLERDVTIDDDSDSA